MSPTPQKEKRTLRFWARRQPRVRPEDSAAVVDVLVAWLARQPDTGVLTFLGMEGEIAADQVANRITQPLFTTRTPAEGSLTMHPFEGPRERHRYGFEQPQEGAPQADPSRIGIVLVPGLCFDRNGDRLGRGKGYYDRLLEGLPGRILVGVTLERLIVDEVAVEPHDIRMTHLATELGVTRI